jgi:RNA ligase
MTLDLEELAAMVEQGYVRRVVHPRGHLALYNYSEKTTYEGVWNDTTRQCRGIILDLSGNVVARPFSKFHNYGEPNAPDLDLDIPVIVTDKLDGSMGTLLYDGLEWMFATRGSFTSDQALHATEVWRERYESIWLPPAGTTCIFEIVYSANRIVVSYGDLDDIILLGARDIATGKDVDASTLGWPGPATEVHPYPTLRAALEAPPRPGQEGLVVFFPDSGERLKLKQEDYVQIHRLVFGLTARRVWERSGVHDLHRGGLGLKQIGIALQMDLDDIQGILDAAPDADWMAELLQIVPEEFGTWAKNTAARIMADVDRWEFDVEATMEIVRGSIIAGDRKAAAMAIQKQRKEIQGALFALLDGKSIRAFAWRAVKPEHETYKAEEGE